MFFLFFLYPKYCERVLGLFPLKTFAGEIFFYFHFFCLNVWWWLSVQCNQTGLLMSDISGAESVLVVLSVWLSQPCCYVSKSQGFISSYSIFTVLSSSTASSWLKVFCIHIQNAEVENTNVNIHKRIWPGIKMFM